MAEKNEEISEEEEAMPLPTQELPEVLVEDIFLRLPVKSLLRLRCVCKPWCALITKPAFVKLHLNRSLENDTNRSLICRGSAFYSVDLDACELQAPVELELPPLEPSKRSDYGIKIGGSCNGLLCIYNSMKDTFLWNPSTRRHRRLPSSPINCPAERERCRSVNFGLGYEPTSKDYKVVRIAQFRSDVYRFYSRSEVKVYSLRSNSWRKIRYKTKGFLLSIDRSGVLSNSALHWVAICQQPVIGSSFIVCIDLKDEKYRELPLPDSLDTRLVNVGVRGEQLCVLCHYAMDRVEVWVMKHYRKRDSWVKEFSIKESVIGSFNDITLECYSKNGEFILLIDFKALVLYDPSGGSARSLRNHCAPNMIETKIYIRSLVPLDSKKKRKKRRRKSRKQRIYSHSLLTYST
ncbi:F-box protein CPR1-like isoform X2 [Macadamia integrifolia]|uniref:F-box protein CPR1-like isoform X2 n=1 Tax=Macadamia integrifolia TaxID=60698 RepID=UPI001C531C01|nr:F-box protein CPR1-like isoform X2 [Macadamia integrifolia]